MIRDVTFAPRFRVGPRPPAPHPLLPATGRDGGASLRRWNSNLHTLILSVRDKHVHVSTKCVITIAPLPPAYLGFQLGGAAAP